MFARSLILGIVLITVAAAAQNNPPAKHDFGQLLPEFKVKRGDVVALMLPQ
ncbi:MAG: hypothetical protein ACKV2Q_14640 [Planctomycetaceae bacterium]